jgi:hypothetical protein
MKNILQRNVRNSLYHKVLRVSAVVCLSVLVFESGLVSDSTRHLSVQTIDPTELNSLTAELTAQKLALQQRESAVSEREIEIGLAPGEPANQKTIYILAVILTVLLVLIVTNYILDFLRLQELKKMRKFEAV